MILPDWMIRERGIVTPFSERTVHADTGMSYGLGPGGYDFRIKQNRTLSKGDFCIASTIERFEIPNDVMPFVVDKSTLARMGISIFNTCAEAGWRGWLTIEIVCHAPGPIYLTAGQPMGQMVFHQMMAPAEKPYSGKYQDQPDAPVAALFERPLSKPPVTRRDLQS